MDRLQAMGIFVAVVDHGGFASAARQLALSPPVVTRAVADLEQHLGQRLLTRTTRVVRVTEAGERYAAECRRILADIARAEAEAGAQNLQPRGTLSLTAPVLFGQYYVTPVLVDYLKRHPAVDAQCVFVDRIVNLVEEGLDVAVRIGELPDSSLQARRVGQVRRVVVASPAYLQAHGEPATPAELDGHRLIASTGANPAPEWRFAGPRGKPVVQRIAARLRTTTVGAAITAAEAGLGLTRLLSYQAAPLLRDGRLVRVLQGFEPAPLPIHLVHHEGRHATPKLRAFIELAAERFSADPELR
ncbi:LysR substrate-binding domain-containing protein [Pelomonas sp. UHG3]|uniref:LysR substrate-binding domain-containing protein n=1 Tax=Roseateles hydrophilus TaxID=2975054 RepID=A0ACC6CG95_9BURK|nr:LysR substrate-binding domain-containing protein [Pelomonas sp. UHG3]MCY4747279.1 LysR substrate-binding domain-containing protein [Pelomonas sp. UHG3]